MAMQPPNEGEYHAYRDLVNLRSVTRSDPAVTDILDTCSFCSLWVFEKETDEWRKLKQEGALFLVKRKTDPEHALFLLNRAGVKNVLLPLIPQEIRLTHLEDGMLAIQRRGEGVQRAVYFGDGLEVRQRFADGIFRICGKDVPLPPGQARAQPNAVSTPPRQSTSGAQQVDDSFAKLFAGLGPPSASRSYTPPPAPPVQTTTTHTQSHAQTNAPYPSATYSQTRTVQTVPAPAPPVPSASSRPPARPDTPPTPPITFSPPITSAPPLQQSRSPVPQTADQLLSSILGMGSPPPRPPSQQPPVPQAPPASGPASPPPAMPVQQPPPPGLPQTADGLLSSMMGLSSPPPRPPSQQQAIPPAFAAPPPPMSVATPPLPQLQQQPEPVPSPARLRDRPPHLDAPPPSSTPPVPQLNGNLLADHRGLVSDVVIDSLPLNFRPSIAGPDPRLAFKLDLLDLIQRDPGFVEHLYHSFCARREQGR